MTDLTNKPAADLVLVSTGTRAITTVLDTTLPAGQQQRTAQSVLDPLSVAGLAELRGETHAGHTAGTDRFHCAQCGGPVFLAQRPADAAVTRDGRAAFFKHFSSTDALDCPRRTAPNLRDVGARQYDGLQEGLHHKTLKLALADCLSHDPRFTEVKVERYLVGDDNTHCVPDVQALCGGQAVAFDLQLATLPISEIQRRDRFYKANGVHHVVLTDAVDLSRLTQQAFCDLHLNMSGRIFAIDETSIAASIRDKRFQLKELSIVPQVFLDRPVYNIWKTALVGTEILFMAPDLRRSDGLAGYRAALLAGAHGIFGAERSAIRRNAAAGNSLTAVGLDWGQISQTIHGSSLDSALADGVSTVLALLAVVEIYTTLAPDRRVAVQPNLQSRLEALLSHRHGLHWAPLVAEVLKVWPMMETAISPANTARLHRLQTHTGIVRSLLRWHASMLAVLFPSLGYRLLVKAPKYAPSLRLSAGRA